LPNPYAIAGAGDNKIDDAPAIAAEVDTMLSMNPRRVDSASFDMDSDDLVDAWFV